MRGDAKVIEYLNAVLKGELTAVNQYWLHYRLLDNLGIDKLARYERKESIEEMEHADKLIARIFFLDGLPAMQTLNRLRIAETVAEVLEADLALEYDVEYCEKIRDYPSRDLFAHILANEEDHIDFLETAKTMIAQMGLQNYIQLQSEAAGS